MRTFTKTIDGQLHTVTTGDPRDAVELRFNGWAEQLDEPAGDQTSDEPPADAPAASRTRRRATTADAGQPADPPSE